ncbi:MAG: outer membrane protein assembly factor BamB, partial [Pirellulaceae bacterium]
TVFGSSIVHALDLNGKPIWSHTIRDHDKFDVALPVSPVIYKDMVILVLDRRSPTSAILALDAATGKVRWEKMRPDTQFGHMTPVFTQVSGKPQMLVCATNELQGVDPNNGEVIWSCKWGNSIWPVSSPVVAHGLVYAVGGRGGQPGAIVDPSGTGDVTATHLKQKIGPMSEGLSSPLPFGDYVYRLNSPGVVRCVRIADGEEIYKQRLQNANTSVSPFVTPEGHIYFASAGKTVVLQAGTELKILAESDLGDAANAAAAVSGGKIFLKGKKFLYAIGK